MLLKDTGIPTRTLNALAKKHIHTLDDLARWLPRKYRDYRRITPLPECQPDEYCAVAGTLVSVDKRMGGKREYMLLRIETGDFLMVGHGIRLMFFSRLFQLSRYRGHQGERVVACGKVSYDPQFGYSMTEPEEFCLEKDFRPGMRVIYPKIGGVSDEKLRELIASALERVTEPFDWELMQKLGCVDYRTALSCCHTPASPSDAQRGRQRIELNDMLFFALSLKRQQDAASAGAVPVLAKASQASAFLSSLPFSPTPDQASVAESIRSLTAEGKRLNMLLQGDVGSGKTVVAAYSMVLAAENGCQAALMAPREALARQHYETFTELTGRTDETVFLHSGMKAKERKEALAQIKNGSARFIIGTHSCVSDDVIYHKLGLAVTDEEHLFGVEQKEKIAVKASHGAHRLSMSATPIPRTLASVLFGDDMQVGTLKTMPQGRLPVKSCVIATRQRAFPFIRRELDAGHRCYVVFPAIEEGEEGALVSIESAEASYREYFSRAGYTVAVANGKMDRKEADDAIARFSRGEAQILLSTTVIEVGINVPSATVILIEQADRFGLASLHQLRGRVGRGKDQSYCILVSDDAMNQRLATICSTTDGFAIAEADMAQRGTGNLIGIEQSGSSHYIDLALTNPDAFKEMRAIADYAVPLGLGEKLSRLYEEHEEADP